MRVLVIGKNGFLGSHVLQAIRGAGLDAAAVHHDDTDLPAAVAKADAVVNCAFDPDLHRKTYELD